MSPREAVNLAAWVWGAQAVTAVVALAWLSEGLMWAGWPWIWPWWAVTAWGIFMYLAGTWATRRVMRRGVWRDEF